MNGKLEWSGRLSVADILSCQAQLREAVAEAAEIEIDLEGCSEVDLTFLQLLCAGQRAACRLQKPLRITGFEAALTEAATENGFFRKTPCCVECGSLCLWLQPEQAA